MFKNIVIPLDGSDAAAGILCKAEELAKLTGAEISLLRVVQIHPFPGVNAKELEEKAVERAEEYLATVVESLSGKNLKITTHIRVGHPAEEILEHMDNYGDLLLMTTHGRGGLTRWAMGSVADRVIRKITKPVMIVRPTCTT